MANFTWQTSDEIEQVKREEDFKIQVADAEAQRQQVLADFMMMQAEEYILGADVPDEDKQRFAGIFPPFDTGVSYAPGQKVVHDGVVYEVIQAHTSQLDWLPADVPALFKVFLQPTTDDGTEVIHDWVQPTGGHDAYPIGARVSHKGNVWQNITNNNTWEPGVYGWEVV